MKKNEKLLDTLGEVDDELIPVNNEKADKTEEKPEKKTEDPQKTAVFEDLEEKMKIALGTKVSINRKNDQKGRIEIDYYSMEELERLMEILIK